MIDKSTSIYPVIDPFPMFWALLTINVLCFNLIFCLNHNYEYSRSVWNDYYVCWQRINSTKCFLKLQYVIIVLFLTPWVCVWINSLNWTFLSLSYFVLFYNVCSCTSCRNISFLCNLISILRSNEVIKHSNCVCKIVYEYIYYLKSWIWFNIPTVKLYNKI